MSLQLLPRSAWNARAPRHAPGELVPGNVQGLAFHWPGTTSTRPISKAAVPRALRAWQDFHMDGRGWSDIAYQVAVDQWGRAWTLRGLRSRSAANGDTDVNGAYGAVLLVLAKDESPTPAMVAATRQVVAEHRRLFPASRRLVGHGQIRPAGGTECPGPAVRAALAAEVFDPTGNEDDMTTPEEIAKAVRLEKLGNDGYLGWNITDTRERLVRVEAGLTALAAALGPTVEASVQSAIAGAVVEVDVNVNTPGGES